MTHDLELGLGGCVRGFPDKRKLFFLTLQPQATRDIHAHETAKEVAAEESGGGERRRRPSVGR